MLAYPRSDGRFISRGYGWVSLEREKDMRDALRLDGMKINDVRRSCVATTLALSLCAGC